MWHGIPRETNFPLPLFLLVDRSTFKMDFAIQIMILKKNRPAGMSFASWSRRRA